MSLIALNVLTLLSCGGSNDAAKKPEPIKRDTVAVNKPDTILKEEIQEKAEVVSAKLIYKETTLEGETVIQESLLKNGETFFLNGCYEYELEKLSFKGMGSNLTLTIGNQFKKEGVYLINGLTITNKDFTEIETIEIRDSNKSIFKVEVTNSGCN